MTTTGLDTTTLWDLPRVGAPVSSDDGGVAVVPVTTSPTGTATTRLWLLRPGDEPVGISDVGVSCTNPAVSPGGTRVAHVRTVDDGRQVVVSEPDGTDDRQVTWLPAGVVGSPRWVDERRLLVVTTVWAEDPDLDATAGWIADRADGPVVHATERRVNRVWDTWYEDDASQHVLLVDTDDEEPTPRDLTPGHWLLPDPLSDPGRHAAVSPDGRLLAFTAADARGDEDGVPVPHLHVVALDGGDVVDLTPDAPGQVGAPAWTPDGRVLVTISRERDFYAAPRDLWAVDPADGRRRLVLGDVDHGLEAVSVARDGRIVVGTQLRGSGRLLELTDDGLRSLGGDHAGSLSSPVATTAGTFATVSSLTEPPEVVWLSDDGGEPVRRTAFTSTALADVDLGTIEERTVTGAAGDDVQVLLLHPPAATREEGVPPPLVHLVHGGPHAAFGDEWHWRWNAARFAAEGWLVALVNFHGSTGFGHAFTRSIHGDWPTMPTEDVLAATDVLVAEGAVDPDRMAITGGSYGGYLVTWLCTVTDRFAAAVAHAAVTDLAGMWASDWSSSFEGAFGGRPWDDPTVLERSPATRYGSLSTPMLVVHGDRDLRVPIDQGRALYGALQHLRVPSRLLVFPDENHWVLDRAASERWYAEVLAWLHRFLDDA